MTRKTIRKPIRLAALSALVIILGCAASVAHRYYAPPHLRTPYQTGATDQTGADDDTLRIAYIGDSWAFMHRNHDCLIASALQYSLHRPVKVHSYGICGLTSKEIYESMFDNSDLRWFLQRRGYTYCFVSSGINDTYKKMSPAYYKQSMTGIVNFLIANHVHPIILEIPYYDIQKSYERQKRSRKALRRLSMLVTSTPMDCKQLFRDTLDELIDEKHWADSVAIIRYKSWNADYAKDQATLYQSDGLHLNDRGYKALDAEIVRAVLSHQKIQDNYTFPNRLIQSSK